MSRLIVKGLPATMTEAKLRALFSERGTVTDCQLKYTREGKFRRFAFVGFDNERDAEDTRHHLNRSFINASRIEVEVCKPFGDETKPRAWSKYAKDSKAYQLRNSTETEEKIDKHQPAAKKSKIDPNKDPKFAEFLEVQNKAELFAPKDGDDEQVVVADDLVVQLLRGVSGDTKQSLTIRGLPPSVKQKSVKEWLAPIRLKAMKIVRNEAEAAAFVTFTRMPDVRRALLRNGEFLGGFKVEIAKVPTSGRSATAVEDDESGEPSEDRKTENEKVTAAILDTGRLFVRNLPYVCTTESLESLFSAYGELADLTLVVDKKTGKSKGFAVVTFVFPENAAAAYAALDGTIFQGRMLHLLPGEEKRDAPNGAETSTSADAKSSFKKQKDVKLKANVGQTHTWNALFLGANAVADTLAAKLNTTKAALLDGEGTTSAGVRMALGETRLVRETRDFLLANNVSLDCFSRPDAKRSDTVIIAKNLPAGFSADELRRMFQRYGDVGRVLLPPEGGISALVEMTYAEDAKKAFKALAYSRLRTMPLYLEWAPGEVFGAVKEGVVKPKPESEESAVGKKNDETDGDESDAEHSSTEDDEKPESKGGDADEKTGEEVDEEEEAEPETTLFVKNLNFETTDESLRAKFESIGDLRSAVVSKKRDPSNPNSTLSMGFGFVQFQRRADAQRALKEMQGDLLDGHSLELKLSHRESTKDVGGKRKTVSLTDQGDCTKLLVRNLPFQASHKELRQLFSAFGELRTLRIPKKMGSGDSHRGFGFVDYLTKADAKRAFEALVHSTHLYGRRLVLEWAKSEETLGELREKTAEHFATGADRRAVGKAKRKLAQDLAVIDDD